MGHSDSEEVSKDKSEIKKIVIIINIYIAPILFSAKRLNLNFQNFFFGPATRDPRLLVKLSNYP